MTLADNATEYMTILTTVGTDAVEFVLAIALLVIGSVLIVPIGLRLGLFAVKYAKNLIRF